MAKYRVPNTLGFEWQKPVLDKDLTVPPSSPSNGDRYIVASGATGDWSGHDGEIAWYENGVWYFILKKEGMITYVKDENLFYRCNGSAWTYAWSVLDNYWHINNGNLYTDVKVGIGTTSPQGKLHVSAGTSGDAVLILEADTDNDNEEDNPRMEFRQDGGYTKGIIGINGEDDSAFSGALTNAFYLHAQTNDANPLIQFALNNEAKMTIHKNGDVYFGSYSKSANGYTKLPNGLILQWGCFINDVADDQTKSFPITFPNAVFCVVAGQYQDDTGVANLGNGAIGSPFAVKNVTTSSFAVNRDNDVADSPKIHWIAIGH